MTPFCLPDLSEGLKEAELVTWHVAEGDHVVVDQPLVSVEIEKAVVEIICIKSSDSSWARRRAEPRPNARSFVARSTSSTPAAC